jgi:gas vesicle protein
MRNTTDSLETFAIGAIVGAGLMYLMDPKLGNSRRAYLREKMISSINSSRRETNRFVRDKRNRAKGLFHEMRNRGQRLANETQDYLHQSAIG